MKVGILAGGLGTRFAEETELRPKPMIEIGGMPILWHIMKYYRSFDFADFAIALGYRSDYIKRWFSEYANYSRNLTVDLSSGHVTPHGGHDRPDWTVDLIETGLDTATGGRIKRLQPYLGDGTCMVTWGDGVSDVDLRELLEFHRAHGKLCVVPFDL